MKIMAIIFSSIQLLLSGNAAFGKLEIVDYNKYIMPHNPIPYPIYTDYLNLDRLPLATQFFPTIRQDSPNYPGDYFYPPDAYIHKEHIAINLHVQLTPAEIEIISNFVDKYINPKFSDFSVLSSLKGYAFEYPSGFHREPYTMLTEGDTVYVISGWLGKFLTFYRVVPGNARLSIPELMKQLVKLTPLSKEIKEEGFRQESDSLNYLLEYVDKDKMFRVRNYLMKTTLPPNPPDSPEKFYNLIEITKFYDKEAIP